ncbi:HMA2 domain-containing protein [Crocosphaera sp.]|uniref:HMA2 domain-containing protein n=1 Tax=Crocosphaera sp. TaxID=2729996 RepID=UPI002626C4D6|nr:metal ABC transporter ATPase [Crocosphaera sp.]MDJ0580172.1 metal ABC transporter ATPase [Crocosphaera sp.]
MIDQASVATTDGIKLQEAEEKLIQFLNDHSEVEMILPVILGIFITSRLQLRGANALIVNLAIASISRQIFVNLKKITPVTATTSSNGRLETEREENSKYTIIHSVPGRIRVKIPRLAQDIEFCRVLSQLLEEDDHVIKCRINRPAASIVINYEAQGLSDVELGLRLLNIMNKAEQTVS